MAEGFYASVQRPQPGRPADVQTGLLLGPYDTKAEADQHVPDARKLAEMVDPRACWYTYGVTRVVHDTLPEGRLNTLIGAEDKSPVVCYRHDLTPR